MIFQIAITQNYSAYYNLYKPRYHFKVYYLIHVLRNSKRPFTLIVSSKYIPDNVSIRHLILTNLYPQSESQDYNPGIISKATHFTPEPDKLFKDKHTAPKKGASFFNCLIDVPVHDATPGGLQAEIEDYHKTSFNPEEAHPLREVATFTQACIKIFMQTNIICPNGERFQQ